MDLKKLQSLGGLVSAKPELCEIEWDDRVKLPDPEGRLPMLKQLDATGKLVAVDNPNWVPTYKGEVVTFDAWVKQLSFGDVDRIRNTPVDPENPSRSIEAVMISESIRLGKEGEEQLTYEQAFQLKPSLAAAFMKAIGESVAVKK
ncbi:phage tail assembly chaperone family protein, TAC [Alcanivorax sp. S6407]|uniref:phage tail assembly chaperone family protein, TAC n=1 Tax=Alcanivorax sp. S6407 TaxID=2926424 RepID=UPI001FF27FD4|nr:phage tail assembly chaperone family protein, TAC [Alcanivorax sp. S6407]MCK0153855.1 phage tail assembly chaperone family protein, TAC [Alcanivorax sp. S6407]